MLTITIIFVKINLNIIEELICLKVLLWIVSFVLFVFFSFLVLNFIVFGELDFNLFIFIILGLFVYVLGKKMY